jgi:C4-dicarboxylate-specific signal transduction histidine kinase
VERDFELLVVSSREEMRWLQVSCSPLFVHDQWIGVQGMASDVTEKKQLQRHLIHSHRLAATGQLAGCIAHEINSPLQGITALLNLIKTEHTDHPETLHCIKLLEQAYASIRNTVQKMVSLSQPHKTEKHPLNINDMIHDALKICHTRLKHKKISLYLNLRRKVPLIQACPQELKQVFLCLIQNSLEAFNRGSMTKVETSLPDQTEQDSHQKNFISIDTYVIDNYIIIDYSDSGPGISSEDLEHVFDPFYTCKKTLGMGIGLSVCYQIIEDHRGYMKIMNMNDQQTVFRIKLPVYNLPGTREGDGYEINEKDG